MSEFTPSKPWRSNSVGESVSQGRPSWTQSSVVKATERIRQDREARRSKAQSLKEEKQRDTESSANGRVDKSTLAFMKLIYAYRQEHQHDFQKHTMPGSHSICVVVRKRPLSSKEEKIGDYDAISCLNPRVILHAPKCKVDGITKYLENSAYSFDHTFSEVDQTDDVYKYTVMPLVAYAFQERGRGTCFAYGQTGSGKTYTMSGIQKLVAHDMFRVLHSREFASKHLSVYASFYEIYGERVFDILNSRRELQIRENERQQVVVVGLHEVECRTEEELLQVISAGNSSRTTHSTEVNEQSSRSHAICTLSLRDMDGYLHGSLSLIDLAGSERANSDTKNHSAERRSESASINRSLLALKECIRALAQRSRSSEDEHVHVPFRSSKLTLALRDSFMSSNARVVMIATVSPNASSWDHAGNTLRYADRVKEKPSTAANETPNPNTTVRRETTYSYLSGGHGGSGSNTPSRSQGNDSVFEESGSRSSGVVEASAPPKPVFQFRGKAGGSTFSLGIASRGDRYSTSSQLTDEVVSEPVVPPESQMSTLDTRTTSEKFGSTHQSLVNRDGKDKEKGSSAVRGLSIKERMAAAGVLLRPTASTTVETAVINAYSDYENGPEKYERKRNSVTREPPSLIHLGSSAGKKGEPSVKNEPKAPLVKRENVTDESDSDKIPYEMDPKEEFLSILDEEQMLVDWHLIALQQNADLLQEEGELLKKARALGDSDYANALEEADVSMYVKGLKSILRRKIDAAQELFARVKRLERALDREGVM